MEADITRKRIEGKWKRLPVLGQVAIVWAAVYLLLKFAITPPLPSSLITMYMSLTVIGLSIYVSVYEDVLKEFKGPIVDFLRGDAHRAGAWRLVRWLLLVMVPIYVGHLVYQRVAPRFEPPIGSRVIHPAPPPEVMGLVNPLRRQPNKLPEYIEEGRRIYFSNCVFCHGDLLDGKGIFSLGLNPQPANFVDPGTIAQLQESYVFWRVSEGGPGLPSESTPWDSAMPRWAAMLNEQDRWKVVLFLYDYTGYTPRTWEASTLPAKPEKGRQKNEAAGDDSEPGKRIYNKRCAHCHGIEGDGQGAAAKFFNPPPLAFTEAKYRYASTAEEELPTDEDLIRTVTQGLPGTGMPAWQGTLSEKEIKQVVHYIKAFSSRFADKSESYRKMKMGNPIPPSKESVEKGRKLFFEHECNKCHGDEGRGDGPDALEIKRRVRNLTRGWEFRRGTAPEEIFTRISRGLWVMPAFEEQISEENRWHIVNYVRSIAREERPPLKDALKAARWEGEIPIDPDDPRWDTVVEASYPLIGQVIAEPRLFTPAINMISARVAFNADEIAFRLAWDDQTESHEDPDEETHDDRVAIQFPVKDSAIRKPYFLRGDEDNPVNLWQWKTNGTAIEYNYSGAAQEKVQPESSQQLKAGGKFEHGQHRVVIKRALATADVEHDLQFKTGFIPMAFAAGDGTKGEHGLQTAISPWFFLYLEPPPQRMVYVYPVFGALILAASEWWIIRRLRNTKTSI